MMTKTGNPRPLAPAVSQHEILAHHHHGLKRQVAGDVQVHFWDYLDSMVDSLDELTFACLCIYMEGGYCYCQDQVLLP